MNIIPFLSRSFQKFRITSSDFMPQSRPDCQLPFLRALLLSDIRETRIEEWSPSAGLQGDSGQGHQLPHPPLHQREHPGLLVRGEPPQLFGNHGYLRLHTVAL